MTKGAIIVLAVILTALFMTSGMAMMNAAIAADDMSAGSSGSSSSSGEQDKGKGSDNNKDKVKSDNPPANDQPSPPTTSPGGGGGTEPVNPNPTISEPPNAVNPIIPSTPPTAEVKKGPDFSCHFHPEAPKCAPDEHGNCPGGFAQNQAGQCHPQGPCPPGFGRHDDDESGKCFHNPPRPCISGFPHIHVHCPPHPCPPGFHMGTHHRCERDIVINIHRHVTSSSSSSSSSGSTKISVACFNEIVFTWQNKIHKGQSDATDKAMAMCLGL